MSKYVWIVILNESVDEVYVFDSEQRAERFAAESGDATVSKHAVHSAPQFTTIR